MRFELYVAARYLKAKRRQAVVGVVTAISVAGVAAGVAALIIALAITNGMRRDLQDRLLGATSHVDLMRVEADGIRDWRPLLDALRQAASRHRRRAGNLRTSAGFARPARRLRAHQRHHPRRRANGQQPARHHHLRLGKGPEPRRSQPDAQPFPAKAQPTRPIRPSCSAKTLPRQSARRWATACWSPARRAS